MRRERMIETTKQEDGPTPMPDPKRAPTERDTPNDDDVQPWTLP